MPVYIVRAGDTDMVKIGWANDPSDRLAALQCAHYEELHVIRLIDGPAYLEKWLHQQFSDRRLRGEWFRFLDQMMTIEPPHLVSGTDAILSPFEIEARATEAGLSIADLCRRADIALSTFYRWKSGKTAPGIGVYQRLIDALPARAA